MASKFVEKSDSYSKKLSTCDICFSYYFDTGVCEARFTSPDLFFATQFKVSFYPKLLSFFTRSIPKTDIIVRSVNNNDDFSFTFPNDEMFVQFCEFYGLEH